MSTPKNTGKKYYTIGLASPPDRDKDLIVSTIDNKQFVRVFISEHSAITYRDRYVNGLSIHHWESLKPLAIQMERCRNKIPFVYIEEPSGTDPTFKFVPIDDILK